MSRPSLQERFLAHHRAHPDVYQLFERFALELLAAGVKRYGARPLMERIRWHFAVSTRGTEPFTINDAFTSRYARMLMEQRPEFAGFFELRKLRAA